MVPWSCVVWNYERTLKGCFRGLRQFESIITTVFPDRIKFMKIHVIASFLSAAGIKMNHSLPTDSPLQISSFFLEGKLWTLSLKYDKTPSSLSHCIILKMMEERAKDLHFRCCSAAFLETGYYWSTSRWQMIAIKVIDRSFPQIPINVWTLSWCVIMAGVSLLYLIKNFGIQSPDHWSWHSFILS